MSKRPPDTPAHALRVQGIPRVRIGIKKAHSYDDAEDAVFLAQSYNLFPDPWQVEVLRDWLATRDGGAWCHKRCGLAVPRQNGKNGALEVRELYGLIVLGEAILHTAHEIKTARKAFLRLKQFFGDKADDPNAKFPDLNALVLDVRKTNGQEAIFLKDLWKVDGQIVRSAGRPKEGTDVQWYARGGFIEFATRTGAGGRGTTYDLLVVDECQHLSEDDLKAVRPVISSAPLGNSQVIYLGTPPDPDKTNDKAGDAWIRIRQTASKKPPLTSWIEYGAPDGPRPDLDDIALLYACNPSLGLRRGDGSFGLDFETIDGERGELTPDGYACERLGWWGNPEAKSDRGVIDMTRWKELRVTETEQEYDKLPTRGLIVADCAPDQTSTSVTLATDGPEGRPLGLVDRLEGTAKGADRIIQLHTDLGEVLEVALTPSAKIFATALTKAKIEFKLLTNTEVGAGCTGLQAGITTGEFAHLEQPELDAAAKAAITKYVGGGDVQQWDRRNAKVDISPLVSYSVAVTRYAAAIAAPEVPPPPPELLDGNDFDFDDFDDDSIHGLRF